MKPIYDLNKCIRAGYAVCTLDPFIFTPYTMHKMEGTLQCTVVLLSTDGRQLISHFSDFF